MISVKAKNMFYGKCITLKEAFKGRNEPSKKKKNRSLNPRHTLPSAFRVTVVRMSRKVEVRVAVAFSRDEQNSSIKTTAARNSQIWGKGELQRFGVDKFGWNKISSHGILEHLKQNTISCTTSQTAYKSTNYTCCRSCVSPRSNSAS